MAERRMFAKSVVLSDAFLDMPMSARCLYFTLGMVADDDGFVGCPKSVMRQCGASQDDMNVLLQKRYVLGFESGVIVIKHWKMNNYLQSDRVKKTTYIEEKETLTLDDKGSYTEKEKGMYTDTMYTQSMYTQDSIDKNRVVEVSIEENKGEYTEQIKDLFNSLCPSFPSINVLTEDLKKAIQDRLKKYSVSDFQKLFQKAEASSFLKSHEWATFAWLIKEENMQKTLNGNYDIRNSNNQNNTGRSEPYSEELQKQLLLNSGSKYGL